MTAFALPIRTGDHPKTGPSVPHVQLSQNSPDQLRAQLKHWMIDHLHDAVVRTSEISEPGSLAFFLDDARPPAGTVLLPPRLNAEFVHVHPDGSLHLFLSKEGQAELIAKGWGERHPLYSPTPLTRRRSVAGSAGPTARGRPVRFLPGSIRVRLLDRLHQPDTPAALYGGQCL
ncbi:luciferase family protein [Nonomuraea sp. NPDC052129]|uniref:luciferase domain-containing protein n=1 Tax=Nonomuraea sp. NPDC052129 TaxID=3154651 RepID=UPI0034262AAC